MICPQCGRTFPANQIYCSFDGSNLIMESGNAPQAAPAPQPTYQQAPASQPYYQQPRQPAYQQPVQPQPVQPASPYFPQPQPAWQPVYQPAMPMAPPKKYMTKEAKVWLIILTLVSMLLSCGNTFFYSVMFGWRNVFTQGFAVLTATVMLLLYIFSDRIPNWIFAVIMGAGVLWNVFQFLFDWLFRGIGLLGYSSWSFVFGRVLPWVLGIGYFIVFLLAALSKIQKTPALIIIGILSALNVLAAAASLSNTMQLEYFRFGGPFYKMMTFFNFANNVVSYVIRFIYCVGMYKAREAALPKTVFSAPYGNPNYNYPNYPNSYQ